MSWTFHPDDLDSPEVRSLLAFHFDEMQASSPPGACHVLASEGLTLPDVTIWSVRENDWLLGVGALKELFPDHGEVKSMRTAPEALGRGVGSALLDHIVAEAVRRGYRRLSLETGSTEPFVAALRLYRRAGFVPCQAFGSYREHAFSRFFTLDLR
ncbi:MAG: GNAT family N-acetyltransferase [Sphingomonadaceae bacterium]